MDSNNCIKADDVTETEVDVLRRNLVQIASNHPKK